MVLPVVRYGKTGGEHSFKERGGIFFLVAGDLYPLEHFARMTDFAGLENIVGQSPDLDDESHLYRTEDYLINYKDKYGIGKVGRVFRYGLLDIDKPFIVSMPVVKIGEVSESYEPLAVPQAYYAVIGNKEALSDVEKLDDMASKDFRTDKQYKAKEKFIAETLRAKGYDAVVWYNGDKPVEVFYFGNKQVRWLN